MSDAELGPEVRALLRDTKDAYVPSATSRAKVHWALERRMAEPRRSRPDGAWLFLRRGLAAALVLAVAGGAAAAMYFSSRESEPVVSGPGSLGPGSLGAVTSGASSRDTARLRSGVTAIPTEAPVAPRSVGMAPELSGPESREGASSVAKTPRTPSVAGSSTRAEDARERSRPALASLEGEIELLRQVNSLRESGNAARALRLLDEYERDNGAGALAQERAAARVLCLCAVGRTARSHEVAARFAATYPKSPQLPRVRAACGTGP